MNPIIHDLDEKDRQPEKIRICGREIDISFIPAGISIPMMNKYDEYYKILQSSKVINSDGTVNKNAEIELAKSPDKTAENLNKMIDIISLFTAHKEPDMTKEWIEKNLSIQQVASFMSHLVKAITKGMRKNKTDGSADKKKEIGSS